MYQSLLRHFKLFTAGAAGAVVSLLLPAHWPILLRVLVGWNFGTVAFLVAVFLWMSSLSASQLWTRYQDEDETAPVILAIVVVAAILSLIAIIALVPTLKQVTGTQRLGHLALVTVTIVTSWLLVPTMFTLHYADLFYSAEDQDRPLAFPKTAQPVFWDFAYFSFTIAAACQTADVATTSVAIRKAVLVHTLVSFLFNVSILGFAINVSAGLFASN